MSSELSGEGADLLRETGSVRDGGSPPDVPVHAGDNPTMSLSELYERREQREGTSGAGASAEEQGGAAGGGVRGSEAAGGGAGTGGGGGAGAGDPVYDAGYPADAGAPYAGGGGYGKNEAVDGQAVRGPVADSDRARDGQAGNWDPSVEPVGDAGPVPDDGGGGGDSRFAGWPDAEPAAAAAGDREGAAGGRDAGGSPGFFGRAGDLRDQGEAGSGERDGGERAGPGTRAGADTSQPGERGEEAGGEKDEGEDGREQKPKDLAPVQHPAPDAETARPAEASAEAAPDRQPDDPRWASVFSVIEGVRAENQEMKQQLEATATKLDELEIQHEKDQARIGELEARLEASPDQDPDGDALSGQVEAEQRADRIPVPRSGETPESAPEDQAGSPEQGDELGRHEESGEEANAKKSESSRIRRAMTAENIGAAGTIAGAVNTAAMAGMHMTPEGLAGLGITAIGVAAMGVGRLEKRRKEKDDRPD